jgi:hypothetical protein
MAFQAGQINWNLNSKPPTEERYQQFINENKDLILKVADVLISYAANRDREKLLLFSMALQKAVDAAVQALELADKKAEYEQV